MIKELSEHGKKIRGEQAMQGTLVHDAIAEIPVGIDLLIKPDGSFDSYLVLPDDKMTKGESITAKKGKARFLLDKAEEVLSYVSNIDKIQTIQSKHRFFLEKLSKYSDINLLKPVMLFLESGKFLN
jgi:hypothetical protein